MRMRRRQPQAPIAEFKGNNELSSPQRSTSDVKLLQSLQDATTKTTTMVPSRFKARRHSVREKRVTANPDAAAAAAEEEGGDNPTTPQARARRHRSIRVKRAPPIPGAGDAGAEAEGMDISARHQSIRDRLLAPMAEGVEIV